MSFVSERADGNTNDDERMTDALPVTSHLHFFESRSVSLLPWRAEVNRLSLELTAQKPVHRRTQKERAHSEKVALFATNYQLVWLRDCVQAIEHSIPLSPSKPSPAEDFFTAFCTLGPSQFAKWHSRIPTPKLHSSLPSAQLLRELGMTRTLRALHMAKISRDELITDHVLKQILIAKELFRDSPGCTITAPLSPDTARLLYDHLSTRLDEYPTLLPIVRSFEHSFG
ncbi:hypothetical protein BWQ96_03665 [Gracilariopsis chorda]|uniref:Uncharacterized protein n=1 Tax=Gracilariopsis chorda TaxID=448386 RepID=A0A2V3IXX6_9FLOR|nr:hypothetical protein BWQ96_03665 [Gracilariopsis chorda]|eukprot:PXF46537.1 hypothetical protein BWQ96_03665 [Gracilariopsis chorda]